VVLVGEDNAAKAWGQPPEGGLSLKTMISFQNADSDFFSFETPVRLWRLLSLELQFFFSFFDLALSSLNLVLRFFYPPFLVPAYAPDPVTGGDVQGYAQGPARGEGV
jgi:hypothetical protein